METLPTFKVTDMQREKHRLRQPFRRDSLPPLLSSLRRGIRPLERAPPSQLTQRRSRRRGAPRLPSTTNSSRILATLDRTPIHSPSSSSFSFNIRPRPLLSKHKRLQIIRTPRMLQRLPLLAQRNDFGGAREGVRESVVVDDGSSSAAGGERGGGVGLVVGGEGGEGEVAKGEGVEGAEFAVL